MSPGQVYNPETGSSQNWRGRSVQYVRCAGRVRSARAMRTALGRGREARREFLERARGEMSNRAQTFAQRLEAIDFAVDDALSPFNARKLARAAGMFEDASLLQGYSASASALWLARRLADERFQACKQVYKFTLAVLLYSDLLDPSAAGTLAQACVQVLPKLAGEADLLAATEFVVRAQSAHAALDTMVRAFPNLAVQETLRPFVYDGIRMYTLREDISREQLERARALAVSLFGSERFVH